MLLPSSPESPLRHERSLKQHEIALKAIVRPDHIQENTDIFAAIKSGDITLDEAQILSEMLIVKVASVDHMTGLDNARAAEVKLTQLMIYCKNNNIPLLGMYFDGDNFKKINEMGHEIGDQVIRALGQALEKTTRPTDLQARVSSEPSSTEEEQESTTQARLGGDEFFITLPGASLEDAQDVYSRISTNFASITDEEIPAYKQKFNKSMTITGGAAQYDPTLDLSPADFIKRCERAMQAGKETRKGTLTIVNPILAATSGRR